MQTSELKGVLLGADKLLRECMKTLLGGHFTVIAEGATLASALARCGGEMPHIVLWLRIPPYASDLASEAREIRARWPLTRIIVLCRRREAEADREIWALLHETIDALLSLEMNVDPLCHAIAAVICGERIVSADFVAPRQAEWARRAQYFQSRHSHLDAVPSVDLTPPVDLTPRQREVLKALAGGFSNKLIARQLAVAEATIKIQVRHILRKIGAVNRTQAAIWAQENGFSSEARERQRAEVF